MSVRAVCAVFVLHLCFPTACKKGSEDPGSKKPTESKQRMSRRGRELEKHSELAARMKEAFTAVNEAVVLHDNKIDCDRTAPRYAKVFVKHGHVMHRMARMGATGGDGGKWLNEWKKKNEGLVQKYLENSRRLSVDCRGNEAFRKAMMEAVRKMKAKGVPLKKRPPG